ncbi:MAG: hypothetical protein ABEJ28_07945 [Salinigranum sp.]
MKFLMCRACGHFVPAVRRGDGWGASAASCPLCAGEEFLDVDDPVT